MPPSPPLVLASTSPYRQRLLQQTGLTFQSARPDYEEVLPEQGNAHDVSLALAAGKAAAVAEKFPKAIIIAADQVLEWRGHLLGKPSNEAAAVVQLTRLCGDRHRLLTAVVVLGVTDPALGSRPDIRFVEETVLTFRTLRPDQIQAYVNTEEWRGCAGGYRLEALGIHLVEKMEGDYFNVLGLPLIPLLGVLRRLGVSGPENG